MGTGDVDYGRDDEEVRPELLSSSEDSSPEADLPFSKKFLNVFVNSTSRSSSKSQAILFSSIFSCQEVEEKQHFLKYEMILWWPLAYIKD